MPLVAVLAGLLTVSFAMSHLTVQVEGTDWMELVLLWITNCMPQEVASRLCKFFKSLVDRACQECKLTEDDPSWCLDDQSFKKKMGAIMAENHG